MTANEPLVRRVRLALADAADPERAAGQQRYMRSEMPFRGVRSPDLKALLRPLLADPAHRPPDAGAWAATVRALWDEAGYREERYAAIAVARHRAYASWATDPAALPLYRHLVLTGAWWDYVDDVAAHLLGPLLRAWVVGRTDALGDRLAPLSRREALKHLRA